MAVKMRDTGWSRDPQANSSPSPLAHTQWALIFQIIILPTECQPQAKTALPQWQEFLQPLVSAVCSLLKLHGQVEHRMGRKDN